MRLFAERGATEVTLREVASAAGVSASLIIHHYGSKDGLKEAVDARATALVEGLVAELIEPSHRGSTATTLAAGFAEHLERDPVLLTYIRRLLVDGGSAAEVLFRSLFDATVSGLASLEEMNLVRTTGEDNLRAAFLLVNDLAVVLLRDQIRAVLGFDALTRSGMERWTSVVLEVYTHGVFVRGESAPLESGNLR